MKCSYAYKYIRIIKRRRGHLFYFLLSKTQQNGFNETGKVSTTSAHVCKGTVIINPIGVYKVM